MNRELLEIQPQEVKLTFVLKKQSSCSIQLFNNSDQYVAFKVKTTTPKKYCVRPNTGVIKPKATCDFTVTMQAQRVAPPDMQCKDKFLVQATVIPFGTTEEGIPSDLFAKDSGKYIEEKKLKVVLVSPPQSPVLLPSNGVLKQDPSYENSVPKDKVPSGVENLPPSQQIFVDTEEFKLVEDHDERSPAKDMESRSPAKDMESRSPTKDVESRSVEEVEKLKLAKNAIALRSTMGVEELNAKLDALESKLREAELSIRKQTEEMSQAILEKRTVEQELAAVKMKKRSEQRRVQRGFPLHFVLLVAIVSVAAGYILAHMGFPFRFVLMFGFVSVILEYFSHP